MGWYWFGACSLLNPGFPVGLAYAVRIRKQGQIFIIKTLTKWERQNATAATWPPLRPYRLATVGRLTAKQFASPVVLRMTKNNYWRLASYPATSPKMMRGNGVLLTGLARSLFLYILSASLGTISPVKMAEWIFGFALRVPIITGCR